MAKLPKVTVTQASVGKLISKSNFSGYDMTLSSYVGCSFGCLACYVPHFLKDDGPWGSWVRVRKHMANKLPNELDKIGPTRLFLGCMSDPYQPIEKTEKITRQALQLIEAARRPMKKVGIFTRSPLVLRDMDLIAQLPRGRVHFTINPYDEATRAVLEPMSCPVSDRWDAIKQLKDAGIRVHVNVAPCFPIVSDRMIDELAERMAELQVEEFFVDAYQRYPASVKRIEADPPPNWAQIDKIVRDRAAYKVWKKAFHIKWTDAWKRVAHKSPDTMPLACDHENKMKVNMNTGEWLDWEQYDSYEQGK